MLSRNHRGFVHHQNGVLRPARPPFLKRVKFAHESVAGFESVALHLLGNIVRPCEAANVLAFGLVNGAGGFQRVALAGASFAPKDA